ncbi:XRE family transcriptional regulator [Streptomyces sp. NPDC046197]|uniref:XRE family transcriptional regulator n=1 Tax=Streptomyces sp. NPDC046197 TaxID=3154337 RepID=UPI0033D9EDB6
MFISNEVSQLFVRQREALGLTQEDLARLSGLSVRMISDLERGRTRKPHLRSLQLLTSALRLDRDELVRLTDNRSSAAELSIPAQRVCDPPAAAPLVVPQQLPMAPRHFVGRTRELQLLDALLEHQDTAPGLAVVNGQSGVGKTALVVRWAHQLTDRFPDGRLYVDLRRNENEPLTPGEAIRDFLCALGVPPGQAPAGLHAQSALLRSVLANKRLLMVLDDAHSADQVMPLLPGTPGCVAVVTSRHKLTALVAHHGAQAISLDVLSFHDARASLERLLGRGRVAAEEEATARLIELCRRSPGALSAAAAHAVMHPSLRLTALLAQLPLPGQTELPLPGCAAVLR